MPTCSSNRQRRGLNLPENVYNVIGCSSESVVAQIMADVIEVVVSVPVHSYAEPAAVENSLAKKSVSPELCTSNKSRET